ncbi:MAG: winged helix-turn-helix transcriptional regulator [Candidatus Lokiarchaeota archaeon]|nr:winged helix-turn-helix transcriptional regulator [Candidatus Lokiarchaeota archaeon]
MDEKIDDLDQAILKYLEKDARGSLKKLAEERNIKTSTIYHRLQRMQNKNIVTGYTVVYNPSIFQYEKLGRVIVRLRPQKISKFNEKFIKSFSLYMKDEYAEIIFIAIMEDMRNIMCIVPFKSDDSYKEFATELKKNPYIENIEVEFFQEIVKGEKLFIFNDELINNTDEEDVGTVEVEFND